MYSKGIQNGFKMHSKRIQNAFRTPTFGHVAERTMAASLIHFIPDNQSLVLANGITKCANGNNIRRRADALARLNYWHDR